MSKALAFAVMLGAVVVFLAGSLVGCGGPENIASVSGTVTLDGTPLEGAIITFTPTGEGSPSYGRTDASGNYTLQYSREVSGAEIGKHTVSVSTHSEGDPDAEPPMPATPEKVPARYNVYSELTETVKAGSNTINFDLDSEGEIVEIESE
jgi:hypothetical protein